MVKVSWTQLEPHRRALCFAGDTPVLTRQLGVCVQGPRTNLAAWPAALRACPRHLSAWPVRVACPCELPPPKPAGEEYGEIGVKSQWLRHLQENLNPTCIRAIGSS